MFLRLTCFLPVEIYLSFACPQFFVIFFAQLVNRSYMNKLFRDTEQI